jgi:Nif-specific regulatory protein
VVREAALPAAPARSAGRRLPEKTTVANRASGAERLLHASSGPAPENGAGGTPPLRTLHKAAARWIGALIRMTSPHPAMTAALEVVERLQERPYRTNFVLLGEPGTGKVGLARALHQLVCPDGPLIRFDVVGFSDDDALAALRGDGKHVGAAQAAAGGTLLIGEAAGLGPRTQAALIRLLKTGRVDLHPNVKSETAAGERKRVCAIAMSDNDLWGEVRAGRFRHDLYWRLARIVLKLPPLRERKQDIGPAVIWMGNRILRDAGLPHELVTTEDLARLTPAEQANAVELRRDAVAALEEQEWQGNLRELETVLERALLLYREGSALDAKAVRAAR